MKKITIVMMGMFLFAGCALHPHSHKATICHKGKTIEVDRNALDAHLKHGDYRGPCR